MTAHTKISLPGGLKLVDDMHLGQPHVIGTYALLGDEPALVDPGPSSAVDALEAGLAEQGLRFDDISALLLTHIHLDHAGATGTLVARYPHLRVYVHERGAPHLIDPERLLRSAKRLYGDDMDRLWGEFRAVPEERVTTLSGGETLRLGARAIRVYDAPGHASHHVVYFDEDTSAAFVGDVGGVRLPGSQYARPATPPPDIDLDAWRRTLDTLRMLQPRFLMLTHFGPAADPETHIEHYWARLVRWSETVRHSLEEQLDDTAQLQQLQALEDDEIRTMSPEERTHYQTAMPIEQSWQGLVRYWRKRTERG